MIRATVGRGVQVADEATSLGDIAEHHVVDRRSTGAITHHPARMTANSSHVAL